MNFLPGPHPSDAVIQPESFDAPIEIGGLAPEILAGLFLGRANAREHWKPGLTVTAALTAAKSERRESDPEGHPPYENDLPDGLAALRSGAPGAVRVEARHAMGEHLLPQSLGLLLAQQWARAGLMLVHGAAFEFEGTGILALGDRGAGKSVLTAAAMAAGARVVSDDWVMVGIDAAGAIHAERLREFMMLRHGLACDQLLSAQPDLQTRRLTSRPKSVIHIKDQPDRLQPLFATECRIDRLWLLRRPRTGRSQSSAQSPASSAEALSALIRASMPLLFSGRFKEESRQLQTTAGALATKIRVNSVETGTDILENPALYLTSLM